MKSSERNRILILLFAGVFMGALDIGIVGPALPAIKSFFGVNERIVSWIFAIYILFFMIGTPLMAKLSDMYGRRPIYILDILLFAVGSLITAFSSSFEILLLGRAIQGFGAGGIFPVAS
ncbi:MAG: MFS transporter, partial [Methanobacterium sp.]